MANEIKKYLDTVALGTLVDQIKAEDAKVLASAKKYTDDAGKLYDAAGSATTAETNAKNYTDQLAQGAVADNTAAIAKLNGGATEAGSVAKSVADAKALIDADVDAVEAKANQNATDIAAINNGETGILAQAKKYTDDEVSAVQGEVNALEAYVGVIPEDATAEDIVGYIEEKTTGIASDAALGELSDRVTQAETDIGNIKKDYLKAADKTALEGKITTAQTAADGAKAYAEGVAGDLADEVKARGDADAAQIERIEALEGQIVGLSGAMHFEGIKDAVPEDVSGYEQGDVIIVGNKEYVLNGDAFVEFGDVSAQAEAITGLTTRMGTAEGKITTLEGEMDGVQALAAAAATQDALDAAVEALEGADADQVERIEALEAKFGEGDGSVADLIADAKAEAIAAAAQDATTKAGNAETSAKGYADGLDEAMDLRVAALEAIDHTHKNLSLLETYTQTEADLADAVAKKHEHSNFDLLEAITALKIQAWDNAEQAAKTYADGLNTAMTTKVNGVESRVGTLETNITTKAAQADLEDAVDRITQNEKNIALNTSAINSFTAITSAEVDALFA